MDLITIDGYMGHRITGRIEIRGYVSGSNAVRLPRKWGRSNVSGARVVVRALAHRA